MGNYQNSILIGVKLGDINTVKSNLQTELDKIKGIKATVSKVALDKAVIKNDIQTQLNNMNFTIKIGKVDASGIDTVINKTKQATKEAEQFKNVMGKSLNIGDGAKAFSDLQARANEIRKTVDSLAKISFNTTKNGGINNATLTYSDNIGKLVTETMGWKQVSTDAGKTVQNIFTTLNTKVSDNIQQMNKLEAKFESIKSKMQGKLTTAGAMGIDPTLITQLQTQLNSLNAKTPISQINQLQQQINALGNNSTANINKLQGAINTLTNRINNIKSTKMDIINKNNIGELKTAENEVIKLQQLLAQVKSGKIIDGKLIASEVATARNSVSQLSTAINGVKTNALSLGSIFKSVFSYAIGGSLIYAGIRQIREALTDIKNVDDSLRNLKRVSSDVSNIELTNFVGKANNMGISLGRTTEDAITATATFKQLGYTFKEASEYMASNSLVLSNVGDMSSSDSASSLVSILKGFKLEAKDTTKVVDLLNESGNRFAITTKDLTEGLRIGGASLSLANNDLAQSTALVVSGTEILRDSNMVANGLKSISMRLRGVKDEEGELVPKMREDLQAMAGVDIKDVNGSFKSTYEIIRSIGERWNSKDNPLSDISKANLAEKIAGKNRANVFASLMQNYEQLDKVYQTVNNSAGSAKTEQESYMNSISGKLNAFKETVKATWLSLTNSNGIKSLLSGSTNVVGGLNSIIKTFGAMPTVIMTVVGAMTIFNAKLRENINITAGSIIPGYTRITNSINGFRNSLSASAIQQSKNIAVSRAFAIASQEAGMSTRGMSTQLAGMEARLMATRLRMVACTVATTAMQMALSMGLSLAISLAISKVMELVNAQENLKKSNEEAISSYKTEKESVTSAINLLKEKKDLENQINSTNDGTKENKDLKEKLLEVERQLAQALPHSTTGYDEQGKAIATSNKQIEEQIKLKKQAMLNDTLKQIDDNNSGFSSISWSPKDIIGKSTNMGYGATTLESIDETIEKYKQLKEEAKKASEEATTSFGENNALEDLQRYSKMLDEAMSKDSQYKILIMNALDSGKSTSELAERFRVSEDTIKRYSKSIEDNTDKQKQNSNESGKVADKTKIVATAMKELNSGADVSKENLQALQQAYPTYGIEAINASESVKRLNDEIRETEAEQHAKDIQSATDSYAKATQQIAKCTGFIDRLNKSQAMTPAIASAINKAYPEIGDNINKVATAQEFLNQKIKDQVTEQASAYEVMQGDSEEFYQSKISNNNEYKSAYEDFLNAFVTDGKEADNIDYENYKTLNELKQDTQHQLGISIENWLTQFVGDSAKGYADDFDNFKSLAQQKASVLDKLNQEIKKINSNMASAEQSMINSARNKQTYALMGNDVASGVFDNLLASSKEAEANAQAQINKLNGAIKEVDTNFDGFGASMKGFSGGGLGGTSDFSGTGGKDNSEAEAKKAQEELIKKEKKMIDDITDAYGKAKDIIADNIEEIDANITMLGDSEDGNFVKRIGYTTEKLAQQREEVNRASEQLMELKSITVTTAEAQEVLESATLKANKELRGQKLEVVKLTQELVKLNQEQIKASIEKEKSIAEMSLEAKTKTETDKLEEYTEQQKTLHENIMDGYEKELKALEEQNSKEEKANELKEKKLELAKAEAQLARDEKQRSVQTLVQKKDGNWQFEYVLDQKTVDTDKKAVTDAKKDIADIKKKQELEKAKADIEAKKTAEDELYKTKEKLIDKYTKTLKEQQDKQKEQLDYYYSDIEKMAKTRLNTFEQQYKGNWELISKDIEKSLEESQKKFEAMTQIKVTWGLEAVDEANNSNNGNPDEYIINKKQETPKVVTLENLKNDIMGIKNAQTEVKNNTIESEDIINYTSDSKNKISKVVESDLQSLKKQTSSLQETNKVIEDEYDSHYKLLSEKQNKALDTQYADLKNFSDEYTKFTDKFLELVQIIYDYRFTNIVSIATSSGDLIMQLLVDMEESFIKFKSLYNTIHEKDENFTPMENIDISEELSNFQSYKQSVLDFNKSKVESYSNNNNNPLYNEKARSSYVDTSKYAKQSAYTLDSSNLSSAIANTTNNNSNKTSNITNVTVKDVTVNPTNVADFISSMIGVAEQVTNLR